MKIIVLGAGAIGSLYGAKLSKYNDVTLIGRQQHVDEINENGLKIAGMEDNVYRLKAATKIESIEENTLILLTTKVYDSRNAIEGIENLIRDDTTILCLQNGLYTEDIVKDVVKDKCRVLRGISNIGAAFLEPGVVQYNSPGYTVIENSEISDEVIDAFTESDLGGDVSKNIKYEEWKKLIINCVINPISAKEGVKNWEVADEKYDEQKRQIVDECLRVAEKDGVTFEGINFVEMINDMIRESKNISSMQQDILKGKKTEIDYLNGIVVELGRKYGIECSVNEDWVRVIKGMEVKND